MKLIDLVDSINDMEDDLIIFQENQNDFNSDIILSYGEENDGGIKIIDGRKYYYLIEVFLAKEFIVDWLQSIDYTPGKSDIARRLYEYAHNDA